MKHVLCSNGSWIDGNSSVPRSWNYDTYFSLYIHRGESQVEMSGGKCPDTFCITSPNQSATMPPQGVIIILFAVLPQVTKEEWKEEYYPTYCSGSAFILS